MDLKEIMAVNLRRKRHDLQMTQEELAERAGLSARYVGAIERGMSVFKLPLHPLRPSELREQFRLIRAISGLFRFRKNRTELLLGFGGVVVVPELVEVGRHCGGPRCHEHSEKKPNDDTRQHGA